MGFNEFADEDSSEFWKYCDVCGEEYNDENPCVCSRADEEYHRRKDEGLI